MHHRTISLSSLLKDMPLNPQQQDSQSASTQICDVNIIILHFPIKISFTSAHKRWWMGAMIPSNFFPLKSWKSLWWIIIFFQSFLQTWVDKFPKLETFYLIFPRLRLLWVLQAVHPPRPRVHVQGVIRHEGEVSDRQDSPQPVPRLQTQEMLWEFDEQGRGPAREGAEKTQGV